MLRSGSHWIHQSVQMRCKHPQPRATPICSSSLGFGKVRRTRTSPSPTPLLPEPAPDELYSGPTVLQPWVGSIKVASEQGKGRAVRTTRSVQAGQLLLVARPAALVTAPPRMGETPSAADLHTAVMQQQRQQQGCEPTASVRALQILGDGSPGSMVRLLKLSALASCQYLSAVDCSSGADPTQDARLARILDLNTYGEPWPDVAAWTCRGQGGALRGFVGVWPAMAMINHSCAPNASAMVLLSPREAQASEAGASGMLQARLGEGGEAGTAGPSESGSGSELLMVVRAARNIRAEEEVTISYAGRYTTSPLHVRQSLLQSSFAFACRCDRCKAEQRHASASPSDAAALVAAYEELEGGLKARVLEAVEEEDAQSVEELQQELLDIAERIRESVAAMPEGSDTRSYLMASCYQCWELLGLCSEALEQQQQQQQQAAGRVGRSRAAGLSSRASSQGLRGTAAVEVEGEGGNGASTEVGSTSSTSSSRRLPTGRARQRDMPRRGLGGARRGASGGSSARAAAAAAAAQASLDSMSVRLQLLQAVCPGSYEHAAMSARFLAKTQRLLGYTSGTQDALEACVEAHAARYGRIGAETLARLVDAHEENELVELLAATARGQTL